MMKYIEPDMEIIEFDEKIRTDQVGGSDFSTGSNENGTDIGDLMGD